MTGSSHRQFGYAWAAAVALVMQPAWGLIGAAALFAGVRPGSTAPDWLEMGIIKHRTWTHMAFFWLLMYSLSVSLVGRLEPTNAIACFLVGFCIGALSHWFGDFGTPMGVPLLNPNQQRTLNLWGNREVSEKVPVLTAWLLVAGIAYARYQIPNDEWLGALMGIKAVSEGLFSSGI